MLYAGAVDGGGEAGGGFEVCQEMLADVSEDGDRHLGLLMERSGWKTLMTAAVTAATLRARETRGGLVAVQPPLDGEEGGEDGEVLPEFLGRAVATTGAARPRAMAAGGCQRRRPGRAG